MMDLCFILSSVKKQSIFIIWIILYRICLDYLYKECIVPVWEYKNFTYNLVNWWIVVYSWCILLAYSLLIFRFFEKKYNIVANAAILFFLLRVVPLTSLIANKTLEIEFIFLETVYWFLIFILFWYVKPIKMQASGKSELWINLLTILLLLIVVFISGYYTHFRMNFSLLNVYDLRNEARGFNIPIIFQYLWIAASNILPILLIYNMKRKRTILSVLIAVVIFLNFSISGSKSVLFKLFFCLFLYSFLYKNILKQLPFWFVILATISLLEFWINATTFISTLIIRRIFFMPVLLDSLYYDYINQIGPVFYTQGDVNISFLIGEEYFGSIDLRANNGMFSDAYMNLGVLGCIVYPFLYTIFFKACEGAFKGIDVQIVFFVSVLMTTTFGSSEFTTAMLTHGIFLLCVTVYFFPRIRTSLIKK